MARLINLAKVDKQSKEKQRRFLDSHPAKQLGLPKNVDRKMFGHNYSASETVGQPDLSELSEGILANFGAATTERLESWAAAKKQDTEKFFRQNGATARQAESKRQREALFITLENLFTNLKRLAYHFNRFTAGTDLFVIESPLVEVMEPLQINKFGQIESSVTYIRTRFSTSLASLTIRGRNDKIEFFIVPTSLVMALSKIEDQLTPVVTVKVISDSQPISWEVNDCWGDPEQETEEFAMWLFDQLIEHSKTALNPQPAQTEARFDGGAESGYVGSHMILPDQPYARKVGSSANLLAPIFEPMEQNIYDNSAYGEFGTQSSSSQFVECGDFKSTVASIGQLGELQDTRCEHAALHAADEPVPFDYKKAWG